ncbi:MAG: sugar phosphate nucleotidyltransferase [Desulforhopalus sp.]|nr:sugar phosphate nucleotidyltransferase [Desulforhopalus sp.]
MPKSSTLAMILAGGRVDELNVLTHHRPKSAVPFGGFGRIIDFSLSNLMNSDIWQVSILSQYRSFSLINHIGTGAAWDMIGRDRQVLVMPPYQGANNEGWYRGPADAIYKNLDYVQYNKPEEVLILSGDHIYSMDYQLLLDYHREKNADITMAFTRVPKDATGRFGIGMLDDADGETGGRLTRFWEKSAEAESNWASMSIFCFKPEVLYEVLQKAQDQDWHHFGREIIPALLQSNCKIYGYKFNGYWGYTRTINEYWQSNMDMLGDNPPIDLEKWTFRTNLNHRRICDNGPTLIAGGGVATNTMIYNGSEVYGTVRNSIIFPGVQIKKGAVVENSVLFFGNIVGENCHLNKVVSDLNNRFGRDCTVGTTGDYKKAEVTVVGWNNVIPLETVIGAGATINPQLAANRWHKEVGAGEVLE